MTESRVRIAPSILSANFSCLSEEIKKVEQAGADIIHVDVMDGHFVPNITVGPLIVEALRPITQLPLDVHLMITNPDAYVSQFAEAGADYMTVHVETCPHLHRTIQSIKERGIKAGVTLNPATPLILIKDILVEVDLLLIMSVNPGFGGQSFIPTSIQRIRDAKHLLDQTGSKAALEVDGGVKTDNASEIRQAGAEILVAGSAIFESDSYADTIRSLRHDGHDSVGQ